LAVFGDILGCHSLGKGNTDGSGLYVVEAGDASNDANESISTTHMKAHSKELSSSKYNGCCYEILP
jgi:hypothetical protein